MLLFAGDETMLLREERGKKGTKQNCDGLFTVCGECRSVVVALFFDGVVPTSKMNARVSELD